MKGGVRAGWDWGRAVVVACVLNLALFLIMPALIAVRETRHEPDELDQLVLVTKVREERPEKKKREKPPEPPAQRPKALKPQLMKVAVQRLKLSLPFELNPRLPPVAGGLELPPIDTSLPRGDISGLFTVGDLDHQLTPLAQMPPDYPHTARRRQIEGWVKVEFIVDEQGRVEDVRVIDSRPKNIFDSAARRAISRWRFKPGTVGGTAVKTKVEQTIKFKLD